MEPAEGFSIYNNPSVIQNNHDLEDAEQALQEAEEAKAIEEGIERELAELSEPELDDDDEEESIFENHHHQQNYYQPQSTQVHYNRSDEEVILHHPEGVRSVEQLEILYNARGVEMLRLQEDSQTMAAKFNDEIRALKHQNTLLKADNGKHQVNLEHYQNVASAQSQENQNLRQQLDELKSKLMRAESKNSELASASDSQNLMISSLQTNLNELQRSDTILRAKKQHEETLRSLKERHEKEVFEMQQEIDKLTADLRKSDRETDEFSSKLRKIQVQHDKIIMDKSDTIKDLQDRLDLAQKRLASYMAETSSQGYSNVKAMHDRFLLDKEKFAQDICTYQEEIQSLKMTLKTKNEALEAKEKEKSRLKNDWELLIQDKMATIESLTRRLNESEQRINQLMRESLSGSTNAATKRLQEELERLKSQISKLEDEKIALKSSLEESQTKYVNFKKKVRQYQNHWKSKEERYKDCLQTTEDDFKAKLLSLRDKMQSVYDSKLSEVRLRKVSF